MATPGCCSRTAAGTPAWVVRRGGRGHCWNCRTNVTSAGSCTTVSWC